MPTVAEATWPQICKDGHYHNMGAGLPPTTISGLKLWLIGDKGNAQGSVATWYDMSGFGTNFTQATADNRPVMNSGFFSNTDGCKFDGVNDCLTTTTLPVAVSIAQAFTLIIAAKFNGPFTGNASLYGIGNSGNATPNTRLRKGSSGNYEHIWTNDAAGNFNNTSGFGGNGTAAEFAPHIFTAHWNGTTHQLFVDNVDRGSATPTGATTLNQMAIGAGMTTVPMEQGGGGYTIAEVLMYDTALSTANRRLVENYLGKKYSIPLT